METKRLENFSTSLSVMRCAWIKSDEMELLFSHFWTIYRRSWCSVPSKICLRICWLCYTVVVFPLLPILYVHTRIRFENVTFSVFFGNQSIFSWMFKCTKWGDVSLFLFLKVWIKFFSINLRSLSTTEFSVEASTQTFVFFSWGCWVLWWAC